MTVREVGPDELADWDAQTVESPGGHVYQSRAWAEHRRRSGWRPRFLATDDGSRVLALTRPWALMGGGSAYLPRGPVPGVGAAGPERLAERQVAVGTMLAAEGIDVVAADPEVPATDAAFGTAIRHAGFVLIEEIQPSRHRVSLPLGGADETAVFDGIAKSTRQRIRGAERDGVTIVRFDTGLGSDGAGEGFVAARDAAKVALDRFYDLLLETGERRHFSFGPRASYLAWWLAALEAGHLVYLEARIRGRDGGGPDATLGDATAGGDVLAGLVLYRHGGRLSTVHSGDHAAGRTDHPGALHLLRWRAIQLAIREGCSEMDLGGVDVAGSRDEPGEGDPLYGLYQHKRGFGGRWLALTGAHERVYDPRGYALGRMADRVARVVRR